MVRTGLGITIIPTMRWRATSPRPDVCARIEGHRWARTAGSIPMSRTPRAVQEVIRAFERVRTKLKLAPYRQSGSGMRTMHDSDVIILFWN